MSALLNLYLVRANGKVLPYYKCMAAPTLAGRPVMSEDWRNTPNIADLQTDLGVSWNNEGQDMKGAVSPLRGGYTLKKDTTFAVDSNPTWHTPSFALKILPSDLQVIPNDEWTGADLRQTELQVTFWGFTVLCADGETTMVVPAQFVDGDAVVTAPPLGYEDDNAPKLT